MAGEAQRGAPHVHERRRVRRRRDAGSAGALHPLAAPRPWYRFQQYYIWPMYTLMGLRWQIIGDLAAFGGAASARRPAHPPRLESRRRHRRQGVLHHLGDRDPAARLPVVGRPRRVRRLRDGHEPDHGDDVPARPLCRGGIVRVGRELRRRAGSGPCTRSRRRSTSARETRC